MAKRIKKVAKLDERMQAFEDALIAKYGKDRNIVAGSILDVGQNPDYPKKRSVLIECACGAQRRCATSDLFQVSMCVECTKAAKAEKRKRE